MKYRFCMTGVQACDQREISITGRIGPSVFPDMLFTAGRIGHAQLCAEYYQ